VDNSSVVAAVLGAALVLSPMTNAHAAELKALAGGGIAGPLNELVPQFESASGYKVAIQYDATPNLIKLATSGARPARTVRPLERVVVVRAPADNYGQHQRARLH